MRRIRLGHPVLCKSLGFNAPTTSKLSCRGSPWLTIFQDMGVAASAVCPWVSVEVLGITQAVFIAVLHLRYRFVMLLSAAEQQAAIFQTALQPSNGAVYSGNARKAFTDEAERLVESERQPIAADQQGVRRRLFD